MNVLLEHLTLATFDCSIGAYNFETGQLHFTFILRKFSPPSYILWSLALAHNIHIKVVVRNYYN